MPRNEIPFGKGVSALADPSSNRAQDILDAQAARMRTLRRVLTVVLIPAVLGYLLLKVQLSTEPVTGTMTNVQVEHLASGTKTTAILTLDSGGTATVLLPRTIKYEAGKRLTVVQLSLIHI